MNKDEMINYIAMYIELACTSIELDLKDRQEIAKTLYALGCRIIADDEIVESMKTYERARQETAREILALIGKPNYKGDDWYEGAFYKQEQIREQIADIYGIELEDKDNDDK